MKKAFIFILATAIFFIACGGEKENTGNPDSKPVAVSVKKPDGAKVFKQYCVTCHGVYGDMGASGAFNLTTSTLTKKERIEVITNGRNLMAAFGTLLSKEKIEAVAEYVETLRK